MRAPRADYLTSHEADELELSVTELLDDTQITVEIKYYADQGKSVDVVSGSVTDDDLTATFQAARRLANARDAERSGGRITEQDRFYMVDKDDLPDGEPKQSDRIEETATGESFDVQEWEADQLTSVYLVRAR